MFERFPLALAFSLGVCFSLVVFVAVQEYKPFAGTKNITNSQIENYYDNLRKNDTASLHEDVKKLTDIINVLTIRSEESDFNLKMIKKSLDSIDVQFLTTTNLISQIIQISDSKDNNLQSMQKDFQDTIDNLKDSVHDTKVSIDWLLEVYQNCNKTTELDKIEVFNSSSNSHTTNPILPEVQSNIETVYLSLYDDDNAEGSDLVLELNTSSSEESEASANNENKTNSETVINNEDADSRSGSVQLYDDDNAEGSYLATTESYHSNTDVNETAFNSDIDDLSSIGIIHRDEEVTSTTVEPPSYEDYEDYETDYNERIHNCKLPKEILRMDEVTDDSIEKHSSSQDQSEDLMEREALDGELLKDNDGSEPYNSSYITSGVIQNNNTEVEFILYYKSMVRIEEAALICSSRDNHFPSSLATIQSVEEQKRVVQLIKNAGLKNEDVLRNDLWISPSTGSKWFHLTKYMYTPMQYKNWNQEQQRFYDSHLEDKVQFCNFLDHKSGYSWRTTERGSLKDAFSICERRRDI